MSLALLFHYLMLNMFRMLIHPFSRAYDLFVELIHGLYCLVRCVLVLRCGLAGVVWYPYAGWSLHATHEITQQISRKLLRIDVLTSETCWALNDEIIKQVTSSWSLFIQLSNSLFVQLMHKNTIKTLRIIKVAPWYFGLHKPSSASYSLFSVSCSQYAAMTLKTGCNLMYTGTRNVMLAKHKP